MKQASVKPMSVLLGGIVGFLIAMHAVANDYEYARIKSFDAFPSSGPLVPSGALIEGRDGALYGMTISGGAFGLGTAFVLSKDGGGCRVLHGFGDVLHFGMDEGATPKGALVEASDQAFYGTTASGGRHKQGTIFAMSKDGSNYRLLHIFSGIGPFADGANPAAALIEGTDGTLYGTTMSGGAIGQGTIFRVNKDGSGYRTLYSFSGASGDGALPHAALLEAKDGSLYGTTMSGGSPNRGTIFKIGKDGSAYAVLYRFSILGKEGANPSGSLFEGTDGDLYGTTASGGAGLGTVFKLKKDGTGHTLLHSFTGGRSNPEAGLIEGWDGALYGTTPFGGSIGWGAVFKLKKDGTDFQFVHSFTASGGDGRAPRVPLLLASDGALYGTTAEGGDANQGTVFRIRMPGIHQPIKDVVQTERGLKPTLDVKIMPVQEPPWTLPRSVATSVPDRLVLKGISGAGNRRFAQVNNQTLATGDRAKVRVGTSNVFVHCIEIREGSVVVRLEGENQPRELTLQAK